MYTLTRIQIAVLSLLFLGFYFKPGFMLIFLQLVVMAGMAVGLYEKNTNLFCKSKKILLGKTVLVSGGTTGMGLEIATDMAHRGAKVIITCPFLEEGLQVKRQIMKSSRSDKVIFKLLDLTSFKSVRQFASDFLKTEDRLDILINNAGIGWSNKEYTEDGLISVMQVNYFGAFLLTLLLLPLLKKTGTPTEPSRIVNTSSVMHRLGELNFEMWNKRPFFVTKVYSNSKLCIVMFTIELSKILKGANVVVNSIDPGAVGTTIFKGYGYTGGAFISLIFTILFKNAWEGAQTALYVALSDSAGKKSGQFFKNCQISLPIKAAFDEETAGRLWEETVKVVGLKDEEWNYDLELKIGSEL